MNEKQTFVQIVDMETGKIDRIANLKEIDAMSPEEKLELSKNKNLFIVTHRLQPIVKVTLKRSVIKAPLAFGEGQTPDEEPEPETQIEPEVKSRKVINPKAKKEVSPKAAPKDEEQKSQPVAPKNKPRKKS